VKGLHAQGGKLKAYSVAEVERVGTGIDRAYAEAAGKAITAAHGKALQTANGRVVAVDGVAPPQTVAIVEWDSLDDAVAFYKSKAWTDLAPQRDKIQKAVRRYIVETRK
jgi:uncharacterized protein (DUF1330 family)